MDRKTFYYLYVNLNSLVELGLQRHAAQLLASMPDDPSPLPELTPEEAEAQMMKSFENMDMSALDQVWENLRNTPLDLEQMEQDAVADQSPESAPKSLPEPAVDNDGRSDLDIYMQRAYTYEDVLRERIDRLFAKADLAAISEQVAQLGSTPQSALTAQLDGAQMAAWLDRYDSEDAVLMGLATDMRRLEMQGSLLP
jgi:hypothetical protein